jgi:hypothetical protein
VVGFGPGAAQPPLDRGAVTLGQVLEHVSLLVPDAPVDEGALAEHRPDRLAQRLGAIDHEQDRLLGIQASVDEVRQQRGGDGGVLGAALPQPERELYAFGGDSQRHHVGAALDLDSVDHHHRQAHVIEPA